MKRDTSFTLLGTGQRTITIEMACGQQDNDEGFCGLPPQCGEQSEKKMTVTFQSYVILRTGLFKAKNGLLLKKLQACEVTAPYDLPSESFVIRPPCVVGFGR